MLFRKKPLVIQAERFITGGAIQVGDPEGVCRCLKVDQRIAHEGMAHIHTLEGPLYVTEGDWIITGVKGERYPCKPDAFEASYEPIEDVESVTEPR